MLWLPIAAMLCCVYTSSAQQIKVDSTVTLKNTTTFTPVHTEGTRSARFFFELNTYHFDPTFKNNQAEIARLDALLRDTLAFTEINSVQIFATSSIDGPYKGNEILANRRAINIRELMLERYPVIDSNTVTMNTLAEDWDTFEQMVKNDQNIPSQEELIRIIENTRHRDPDAREWLIKTLDDRKPWNYLKEHVLSELRYGVGVTLYYNITSERSEKTERTVTYDTTLIEEPKTQIVVEPKKPWFALKTNLLYDAGTLANIGFEIPIGQKWSVMGEFMNMWWVNDNGTPTSTRNRSQIRNISLEGRRWFSNKEHQLTGWFGGVHATYGSFDFERNKKGKQSKDIISGGLVGGFAHTINKSGTLRLEYALGFGYATLSYKEYTAEWNSTKGEWEAYFDQKVKYNWLGPTKVGVSLVWMLNTPRWFTKSKAHRKEAAR